MLVKDGLLNVEKMRKNALSHEQVYSQLRQKRIFHLGQVQRVYIEANGAFSIFLYKNRNLVYQSFLLKTKNWQIHFL
ncbi:MAG: hypothetical protein JETT_3327 [Candidatus Jettenia ecosi]|uniref:YetF C-terminal domain-containing protein n=1 Tax=Candidatus Jettenia ecosi TaxID=2494326 RepID=A0A533Q8B6_9BACT|nr:MAG: hypothetical protein JETT_3327 [Candidatus Jettenia ecosi]